jgi:glycerol-3-phosphate dehydrogenase
VAELAAQDRHLAQRLIAQRPEIMAQIEWGITEEFLTTVNDALKQRTQLYYRDQNQGLDAIPRVSAYMAAKLGWSDEHRARMEQEYRDEVTASRAWQDDYEAAMRRREDRRRMLAPSKKGR